VSDRAWTDKGMADDLRGVVQRYFPKADGIVAFWLHGEHVHVIHCTDPPKDEDLEMLGAMIIHCGQEYVETAQQNSEKKMRH
jgi:hypothetical protein